METLAMTPRKTESERYRHETHKSQILRQIQEN